MSPFVCVMFVTNFLNSNFKKGVKKRGGGTIRQYYFVFQIF